jgi:hypothetical protein
MTPTASKRPTAIEEPTLIPAPSAPPGTGQSQQPMERGKLKSQAQNFNPRKVEPMPSGLPSSNPESSSKPQGGWTGKGFKVPTQSSSPSATAGVSPNTVSTPTSAAGDKLTKQEKKEQKHEEGKELKRERKEGSEKATASLSPQSSP